MSGSSRAFFTLLDASGALVPGATVTVTVDGVTGAGTVTETSVGRYHYNLTHAEAAQSRRIFASAPLARPVEIFWQPTPDNAGVATLTSRLTADRATGLDRLDATISSRAATADARLAHLDAAVSSRLGTADYVAPDNAAIVAARDSAAEARDRANLIPTNPLPANDVRLAHLNAPVGAIPTTPLLANDPRLAHLDAAVSSRVATADARLGNLDASISSRLASAGYVAPDNVNIVAARDRATEARDRANLIPTTTLGLDERTHLFSISPADIQATRVAAEATQAHVASVQVMIGGVLVIRQTWNDSGISVPPETVVDGTVVIVRGVAYDSIDFSSDAWASLAGQTLLLTINGIPYQVSLRDGNVVRLRLTRHMTFGMRVGIHPVVLVATRPDGAQTTLFSGVFEVR